MTNQRGYTLAEILVTMAVASILMAVAIPNFSDWMEKERVNAEAQRVYFDLLLARTTAVRNNNNVVVTFNSSTGTYSIHDDQDSDGTVDTGEAVKNVFLENKVRFAINSGLKDMDGNTVSNPISLNGGNTVTFTPRGEADVSGEVYMIPIGDIGYQNERMRAVSIIQATGNIEYWEYDAGQSPGPWS